MRARRRPPRFEELEPRILHAADFAAVAPLPGGLAAHDLRLVDAPAPAATPMPAAAALQRFAANLPAVDDAGALPAVDATGALPAVQHGPGARQIVFVDAAVEDAGALLAGLAPGTRVVHLEAGGEGLRQITDVLAGEHDLAAVHLLSHGAPGEVRLGASVLSAATLESQAGLLRSWRAALGDGADLLIYGCSVAASDSGLALMAGLQALTGADVAASDDATGASAAGGDWVLERQLGRIDAAPAFAAAAEAGWAHTLALPASGGETLVNDAFTAGSQRLGSGSGHSAAMAANGNYVLVGEDGIANDVYARLYRADGTPLNAATIVNTTTSGTQDQPAVAMDASGNYVVAWRSPDAGGTGIFAQRFDATGAAVGGEFQVNVTTSNNQELPAVAMYDGGFVIAWATATGDGSGYGVYVRRYDAAGNALGGELRANTTTANDQTAPTVAMSAGGSFIVAWQSFAQDGSGWGIYAQRFSAAGAALGGEVQVSASTGFNQTAPSAAMDAAGNALVAWSADLGADGSGAGVYARRIDSAGNAGSEFRVNTATANDQTAPSVAMAATGEALIVWTSSLQDGSGDGVYGQFYTAAGTADGAEFRVNTTTSLGQNNAHAAIAGGRAVVAWMGNGTGDGDGVFLQRYAAADRAPAALLAVPGVAASQVVGAYTFSAAADLGHDDGGHAAQISFTGTPAQTVTTDGSGALRLSGGAYGRIDGITTGGAMTFAASVRFDTTTPWQRVFDFGQANSTGIAAIYVGRLAGDSDLTFTIENNPGTAVAYRATAAGAIVDGSWLHFTATVDGAGAMKLYVNGVLAATGSAPVPEVGVRTNNYVGHSNWPDPPFEGAIDNLLVLNGVLDAGQVAALYGQSQAFRVAENAANGTVLGTVVAGDPDAGDGRAYSLADSAGGRFAIAADGTLTVADGSRLDFESAPTQTITARAADGSLVLDRAFGVAITDVNEAPVITSLGGGASAAVSVAENTSAVASFAASDPDAGAVVTWRIAGGADAARFAIDANSGALAFAAAPDFEAPADANADNVYQVVVEASDGSLVDTQALSVTVTDVANTLTVTTTADNNDSGIAAGAGYDIEWLNAHRGADGAVSLREAVFAANNTAGTDTIAFSIAQPLIGGVHTIGLGALLPALTDAVVIDGASEPDAAPGRPVVALDGGGSVQDGLRLWAGSGGSTLRGLLIQNFTGKGIDISRSSGNLVVGNWIGLDGAGLGAAGNGIGINVFDAAGNRIGGAAAGERNIVSGNTLGISIVDDDGSSTGNRIAGNWIGTNAGGSAAVGNLDQGIYIEAAANIVGGLLAGEGNVIAGTTLFSGVRIDTPASSTLIAGNLIGLDATGTTALPNAGGGIDLSSADNQIGGTTAAARNVISGNAGFGLRIAGAQATGNRVTGNYIGTDAGGLADLDGGAQVAGRSGVVIGGGASGNLVGTDADGNQDAAERNLISGNNGFGVELTGSGTSNNRVQGNWIGTDASGMAALGNSLGGVSIRGGASGNQLGSGLAGAGNVIAANDIGVLLADGVTGNRVQGNLIGLGADGATALGHAGAGVSIANGGTAAVVTGNLIGSDGDGLVDAGERNIISANRDGVLLESAQVSANTVAGNWIGTDASGLLARGNTRDGIRLQGGAHHNLIGGTLAAQRNLLDANGEEGLQITDEASDGNVVRGNWVGIDASGTATLGNGGDGIFISLGADDTVVGGSGAGEGNWIAGNAVVGIEVDGASTGTVIQGNRIGTDLAGNADWGHGQNGILLENGASGTLVGGTSAAAGNLIAYSGRGGVWDSGIAVTGNASTGNVFLRNSIFANRGLGIDLGADGVTVNDAGDADSGPNDLLNRLQLTHATTTGSELRLGFGYLGAPNTDYRVDVYANSDAEASGTGEGRTWLGSFDLSLDGSGSAQASVALAAAVPAGLYISTTVTRTDAGRTIFHETSEFSNQLRARAPGITVTRLGGSSVAEGGATAQFSVVLDAAPGAAVTIALGSSDALQGTASLPSLSFTAADWNVAQTVTVSAGDDSLVDGDRAFTITTAAASSADAAYDGLDAADLGWTALDDDTRSTVVVDTAADTLDGDTSSLLALLGDRGADGRISLREALRAANQSANGPGGADRIAFAIAGTGVHTIGLGSLLPAITDAVEIDARSDDSFAANGSRPAIVLDGQGLAGSGLQFAAGAAGSRLSGLVVRGFGGDGIVLLAGADGITLAGNAIGRFDAAGADAGAGAANGGSGIVVASANNLIGGPLAGDRNLIGGNALAGVSLVGAAATGNTVAGNWIGLAGDGSSLLGNGGAGVQLLDGASLNLIGGANAAARNVISGNGGDGLRLGGSGSTSSNIVRGNYIGTDAGGTLDRGNAGDGIDLRDAAAGHLLLGNLISGNDGRGIDLGESGAPTGTTLRGNLIGTTADASGALGNAQGGVRVGAGGTAEATRIGGPAPADGNTIAFNGGTGVEVRAGQTTTLLGNRLFANGGPAIDLGGDGVTANDAGDADSGPNGLQNSPLLTAARTDGSGQVRLIGRFDGAANSHLRLQFFASGSGDASGHGEAERLLGEIDVDTDAAGQAAFDLTLTGTPLALGETVSATATVADAGFANFGATSEMAANRLAAPMNTAPVITVPAGAVADEDVTQAIGGLALADTEDNLASLQLSVGHGRLQLDLSGGATVIAGANGSAALTLGGTAAQLNAALAGLQFTGDADFNGSDTLQLTATDLAGAAGSASVSLTVNPVNDAPAFAGLDGAPVFTTQGRAVVLDGDVQLADVELGAAGDFGGSRLTLERQGGADAADRFVASGRVGGLVAGGDLFLGPAIIGSVLANGGGRLSLQFLPGVDGAAVDEVLRGIAYRWEGAAAAPASVTLQWRFDDGNLGAQGSGGALQAGGSSTVAIVVANAAPSRLELASPAAANLLVNGSFEDPGLAPGAPAAVFSLPGWSAVGGDGIEVWPQFDNGGPGAASDGGTLIELDADHDVNGIAQQVATQAGQAYVLSLDFAHRAGSPSSSLEVWWRGDLVATLSQTEVAWKTYRLVLVGSGGADELRLTESAATNDTLGSLLDNVRLVAAQAPTIAVAENSAGGTPVAQAAASDPDLAAPGTLGFSLVDDDGGRFTVDAASGEIRVAAGAVLDHEAAATRQITLRATDAGGLFRDQVFTIGVTDVDEAPVLGRVDLAVAEGATVTLVAADIGAADPEGAALTYRLGAVSGGRFELAGAPGVAISGFDAAQLAAGEVRFVDDGDETAPSFTLTASDGALDSATLAATVSYTPVNDAPTLVAPATLAAEPQAGFTLPVTLGDVDAGAAALRLTLTLHDGLVARWPAGMAAAASAATTPAATTWTLDGALPALQQALDGLVLRSGAGFVGATTIELQLDDLGAAGAGGARQAQAQVQVQIDDQNAAPQLGGVAGPVAFVEGGAPVPLAPAATVSDIELDLAGSAAGASLRLQRVGGADALDRFSATGTLAPLVEGGVLSVGGIAIGQVTIAGGGVLELQFDAAATPARVAEALRQIAYAHGGDAPPASLQIGWTFSDGNTGAQGLGGPRSASAATTVTITAVNDAPVFVSGGGAALVGLQVDENRLEVTTLAATDPDGPALQYRIAGGADGGRFVLDGATGVLSFAVAPDFEQPLDADGDNLYELQVEASDGSAVALQTLQVRVLDVDEGGVGPLADADAAPEAVDENAPPGTRVGLTAQARDPDTAARVRYTLADDAGGRFAIDADTGVVTVAGALDREQAAGWQVVVRAISDDGSQVERAWQIAIGAVDDLDPQFTDPAPDGVLRLTVAENEAAVATIAASDGDVPPAPLRFSIAGGADAARFRIDADTGALRLATAADYEAPADADADNHLEVVVQVSDGERVAQRRVDVAVLDVNEAPQLQPLAAQVAAPAAAAGSRLSWTLPAGVFGDPDQGDSVSISLVDGPSWLSWQADRQALVGTPGTGDVGERSVILRATDRAGASVDWQLTLSVTAAAAPTPASPGTTASTSPTSAGLGSTGGEARPNAPAALPAAAVSTPAAAAASPAPGLSPATDAPPGRTAPLATDSPGLTAVAERNPPSAGSGAAPPAASTRPGSRGSAGSGDETLDASQLIALYTPAGGEAALLESLIAGAGAGHGRGGIDEPGGAGGGDGSEFGALLLRASPAQATATVLSAGFVWWALRATGLVASVLASTPVWRHLDPIPILGGDDDEPAPRPDDARDDALDEPAAESARDEAASRELLDEARRGGGA